MPPARRQPGPRISIIDEDLTTCVARALCEADGHDPEEHVYVGSEVVETDGADHYRETMGAAWTTYTGEARRMIAAVRAMGLVK